MAPIYKNIKYKKNCQYVIIIKNFQTKYLHN